MQAIPKMCMFICIMNIQFVMYISEHCSVTFHEFCLKHAESGNNLFLENAGN